jgi:hypothetical protein
MAFVGKASTAAILVLLTLLLQNTGRLHSSTGSEFVIHKVTR